MERLEGFRLRPDGVYAAIEPDRRRRWSSAVLGTAWYPTIEERDRRIDELKAALARYQERYGSLDP